MLYRPSIATLPADLLNGILDHLSPLEWKALRLTCKSLLGNIATEFLFRRVRLSALNCHHKAFIAISKSPRLSNLPQHLTWYEVDTMGFGDETALQQWFSSQANGPQTVMEGEPNPMTNQLCHELSSSIHNSVWTPSGGSFLSSTDEVRLEEALGTLLHRLTAAFDLMPNINTITSRPWPRDFIITTSAGGYEFQSDVILKEQERFSFNWGLILILNHVSKISVPQVTSLHWADTFEPTWPYLGEDCLGAFKYLTSIDLCIHSLSTHFRKTCLALSTARELRHLKLCFEQRGKLWLSSLSPMV